MQYIFSTLINTVSQNTKVDIVLFPEHSVQEFSAIETSEEWTMVEDSGNNISDNGLDTSNLDQLI